VYGLLWRALPGPWWVRALIIIFVLTLLLIACVMFIFPWVDHTFFAPADPVIGGDLDGSTVDETGGPLDGGTVDVTPSERPTEAGGLAG